MPVIKFAISSIVAFLYFSGICSLSKLNYPNSLFFDPGIAFFPAFINSSLIVFLPFIASARLIERMKSSKKVLIVTIILIVLFALPVAFLKSGVVADEKGIYEKNLFGRTVKEYDYSDIIRFDMTVQYGVQYDIEFYSGETLSLASHQVITFNAFKSDYDMMMFDKILAQHALRDVEYSYRIESNNTKRFFSNEEVFQYFDGIFSQYY